MTTTPPSVIEYLHLGSASANQISIKWAVTNRHFVNLIGAKVHYQRHGSTLVQYSDLLPPEATNYSIDKLLANTNYKICLALYNNATTMVSPTRHCMDAMTTTWHIPVSIGSSIGAFLALAIIILIVLMSQCKERSITNRVRRKSSRYDSQFDSQYDSVAHDPESSNYYPHGEFSDVTMHEIHEECYEKGGVMLEVPSMNHTGGGGQPHMHICAHNLRCLTQEELGSLPIVMGDAVENGCEQFQPRPGTSSDQHSSHSYAGQRQSEGAVTPPIDAMSSILVPVALLPQLPKMKSVDYAVTPTQPYRWGAANADKQPTNATMSVKTPQNTMNGRMSDHQLCTRLNTV